MSRKLQQRCPERRVPDNRIVQSYLFFGGRCEEALQFYCNALGAQADLVVHYKESPEPPPPGVLC
jgi:PhnB protein